jgi:pyruvate-ferredoxin/flavodoxin oxidoreductase
VLPLDTALAQIRRSIEASYGHQGEAVVARNLQAVEGSLAQLTRLDWLGFDQHQQGRDDDQQPDGSAGAGQAVRMSPALTPDALSAFEREVILPLLAHQGDRLPVSAFPCDGTWPTGTARLEKRNLAEAVPVWQSDLCVQCGKCVMVCPHAAIRAKVGDPAAFAAAPVGYATAPARDPDFAGQTFTIAVAPEDCTGCEICVQVCPARDRQQPSRKALVMQPQPSLLEQGRIHWRFFEQLPEVPRTAIHLGRLAQQQLLQPLFEFSGACAGCGETPYLKLLSQLFGDRLLVANATGCSSIYGGNLPTTPWSHTTEGRGPAWSNSLFEDNAEFGYGMRLALDAQRRQALTLLTRLSQQGRIPAELAAAISQADESDEAGIAEQRQRLDTLGQQLRQLPPEPPILELLTLLDALSRTSVWLVGGDGWAYDIGFGGLDHVLASGSDVNVLVLDTEVYSNTGGQASKATPLGAVAAFASGGKANAKKDLGLMTMTYGHVYVASVAMGARDEHTLRAFLEAESYPGPSLILAYAHCTAHGIAMAEGMAHQKAAVDSGRWLLYRHDPRRRERGLNPLQLDMGSPHRALDEAMALETRFTRLALDQPQRAAELGRLAESAQQRRWALYRALADHA